MKKLTKKMAAYKKRWRIKNLERFQASQKRWKENNPERYQAIQKKSARKRRKEIRAAVLEHYGGKCECCWESQPEFLAIDHIDGGGAQHRKQVKMDMSYWLYKNNFPLGFRLLCHNCNQSKGYFGYCPHRNLPEDYPEEY